jgi:hypothetical protein
VEKLLWGKDGRYDDGAEGCKMGENRRDGIHQGESGAQGQRGSCCCARSPHHRKALGRHFRPSFLGLFLTTCKHYIFEHNIAYLTTYYSCLYISEKERLSLRRVCKAATTLNYLDINLRKRTIYENLNSNREYLDSNINHIRECKCEASSPRGGS